MRRDRQQDITVSAKRDERVGETGDEVDPEAKLPSST